MLRMMEGCSCAEHEGLPSLFLPGLTGASGVTLSVCTRQLSLSITMLRQDSLNSTSCKG